MSSTSSSVQAESPQQLNHLANAKSPYLLQHKYDPVDWHEFNDEAFQKAQREGKLIFLSIGYSSCHWCHQMRYDSFSHPKVAEALNSDFISLKVDREERPDVDATYMQFIMALNGSGGWPLSAFLTPDAKPIFGGTFFPRRQFLSLIDRLSTMWQDDRQNCLNSANSIAEQLATQLGPASGSKLEDLPSDSLAISAAQHWLKRFDSIHGGFGSAPKFPTVSNTHHLLHRLVAAATKSNRSASFAGPDAQQLTADARRASLFTLLKISRGGITDHLAGGIARYSVDEEWRVPHFEKMLYDQAQLLTVFCEAIQLAQRSGETELRAMIPEFESTARGIIQYLRTDLRHPDGGLYSAEDADSLPHRDSKKKKEGAFYVWELDEVQQLLGSESNECKVATSHYGLEVDGNIPAESDPHGELTGQNMLHALRSISETAKALGLEEEQAESALKQAKAKLLAKRNAERPRPHLDDKIISAWNGLAISALCTAAEVLNSCEAKDMALSAADFILSHLYDQDRNRLRRSWRDGSCGPWGFAPDYAFLTQGLLDLFQLTGEPRYLETAVKLQNRLDEAFWEDRLGGYLISEAASSDDRDGSRLLTRQRDEQDGAEPSAASVAAHNLVRLGWMLASPAWHERAEAVIKAGGVVLQRAPYALGTLTTALLALHDGGTQIVLCDPDDEMLALLGQTFMPSRSILYLHGDRERYKWLEEQSPVVKETLDRRTAGKAEAHICRNFTCGLPLGDAQSLKAALEEED